MKKQLNSSESAIGVFDVRILSKSTFEKRCLEISSQISYFSGSSSPLELHVFTEIYPFGIVYFRRR